MRKKMMFEKNTDRLIILSLNFSCDSQDEKQLVKYLKSNLTVDLKRRAESLSCEILQNAADGISVAVKAEFLLGLMEKPRVIYGISHLLFLTIKKFQKLSIEIDGNKVSSEITDEGLHKLFKKIYERLKEEKG
jgi:hypothetical protein